MTKNTAVETRSFRLPKTAVPTDYELKITPDLKNATFSGEEKVHLTIGEPTRELVLNSAELQISDVALTSGDGTKLIGKVQHDEATERATISFDGTAGKGSWVLELKFTGILNDKLKGFYRSTFKNAKGETEAMATTKFEPCDARRAFPCWDEPAFKARFTISLVVDNDLNAVSNARLAKTTDLGNGKKQLDFAPTIKMSTYLVAYIVGKLEASEPVFTKDGKEIRVWSVPGKSRMKHFALEVAKFSLEYVTDYFKQPYPSDKLDLVAIPDFASGAMENYGCITFRETALLVDLKTASHAELERVAEVVCHENAHMWFGDFVTMSWWNGLWLNEAFATFMANKAVDAYKPEWKFWETFATSRAVAMRTDGLCATRTIEFPVNNPEEARQMFDVLTYEKGCSILRMLELFLGEDKFRDGIRVYLAKHAFANADTPDLWAGIESVVGTLPGGLTVSELMNSWVFQAGYPVVSVEESPVTGSVTFKQQMFRYLNSDLPAARWDIPAHVRATVGGANTVENKVLCLSKPEETVYVGEGLSSVVVNAGGHGFYRVQYSDSLRKKLMASLGSLSAPERFNFVNDLWATVQSGQTSVKDYLYAVHVLTSQFGESDVNVFSIILGSLASLRLILPTDDATVSGGFLQLARELLTPAFTKLGWSARASESAQDAQLRGSIMASLGAYGDPNVIKQAETMFAAYKKDKTSVDSNLIGAVVNTLARNGDAARYDEFIAMKNAATTPQEENRFLMTLAQFRQPELIARTLNMCIDGTVRSQDAMLILPAVLSNPFARAQAWEFVKANWEKMESMYPMQAMGRIASGVTALVSTELEADVRKFFDSHYVKGGEKQVKQYIEQLSIAVRLAQREKAAVETQLRTEFNEV